MRLLGDVIGTWFEIGVRNLESLLEDCLSEPGISSYALNHACLLTPRRLVLATAPRFSLQRREIGVRILRAYIRLPHRAARSDPEASHEWRGPLRGLLIIAPPANQNR